MLTATRVAGDPETELAYYPEDPQAELGRQALNVELSLLKQELSTDAGRRSILVG